MPIPDQNLTFNNYGLMYDRGKMKKSLESSSVIELAIHSDLVREAVAQYLYAFKFANLNTEELYNIEVGPTYGETTAISFQKKRREKEGETVIYS